MRKPVFLIVLGLVLASAACGPQKQAAEKPTAPAASGQSEEQKLIAADRKNPAYMWDLGDLYPSPQAWTAAHDKTMAEIDKLDGFKGTLGKSADQMLQALSAISAARKESDRLNVYASLKGDEDVRIAPNQERQQLATALMTKLGEKTSWLVPEILEVGADKVHAFEQQSPELAR